MTDDALKEHLKPLEERLLQASRVNAAAAAKKVISEANRAANEVREEFEIQIANINTQLGLVSKELAKVNAALVGLQNVKLVQQGVTSMALAVALTVGWKAIFG